MQEFGDRRGLRRRRGRIVVFGLGDGLLRREVLLAKPFFPDQQWVFHGDSVALIAAGDRFRFAASLVLAIRQRSDGSYALLHLDTETELVPHIQDTAAGGTRAAYSNMRHWVSSLSPDGTRACVDGLVPLIVENVLSPTFRGDTLVFVSRAVDATDSLRTVLYKFVIDDRGCDWLTTAALE